MPRFRDFLECLVERGELEHVSEEIDIRQLSARVGASKTALWFARVRGYDMAVVSGILGSRKRMGAALGCGHRDIGKAFQARLQNRQPPRLVNTAPAQEVVLIGDQVDLTALPVPLISQLDGGPYITAGVGVCTDPEYGRNVGCYRLMIRTERETGIDMVGASDLKLFYSRALRNKRPLPFAVAIGTHPSVMRAAAHMATTGLDEFALAGGLAGSPIDLVRCRTIDLEVPADAEIVLEGEILPDGWTEDEGRFGDFTGFVGPIKWNPVFRVNAITHRRNPIFYALHMPDEVDYLVAPPLEGSAWQALAVAGVTGTAVYAPATAGCTFHLYASIRKRPGEGKNALLALMSLKRVKHVVVTDDDVDIFDPAQLERALTYRVRPTRDIIVVDGARGSHLDPSIQLQVGKGPLAPLTAKWGVDATIPEGSDLSEYETIEYPFAAGDRLLVRDDVLPDVLCEEIAAYLAEPRHFVEVLSKFAHVSQRTVLQAWSRLRQAGRLAREETSGKYLLSGR
ncbi:MAG: UbiD family decarboxylase [Hyphomicrobiales bacterium]|nr:UbiD family decarboxylase [Hyphomicrobiales bacterium]